MFRSLFRFAIRFLLGSSHYLNLPWILAISTRRLLILCSVVTWTERDEVLCACRFTRDGPRLWGCIRRGKVRRMLQHRQDDCTGFSSQGRARLRAFLGCFSVKNTQLSPSLTRKPCTLNGAWSPLLCIHNLHTTVSDSIAKCCLVVIFLPLLQDLTNIKQWLVLTNLVAIFRLLFLFQKDEKVHPQVSWRMASFS